MEKRPSLEAERLRAEAMEERIAVARAGHFPSLDLFANYYLKRTGPLEKSQWDAGLQLVIPIFQGGTVQAQVREAATAHRESVLRLENRRRSATSEVREAWESLRAALARTSVLEQAEQAASDSYDEQNRDYRYGLVTNLDVLQAMRTRQEIRRNLDRARYAARWARARLDAAVGTVPAP